jgi:transcriptional regulator with XRE-family HTH domain
LARSSKALRAAAGFTREELATISGLSVHAVSALERGERRRPHVETVRALLAALDLTGPTRDALLASARAPDRNAAGDELRGVSLPLALTAFLGRDSEMQTLRPWLAEPAARLITLTGPGGAGKTRLALELARAIAAEGEVRVLFVGLAAVRNSAFVARSFTGNKGRGADVRDLDVLPGSSIGRLLRQKETLMPNVHELIRDHVTLSIRCLDRLYLHARMPKLQTSGGCATSSAITWAIRFRRRRCSRPCSIASSAPSRRTRRRKTCR